MPGHSSRRTGSPRALRLLPALAVAGVAVVATAVPAEAVTPSAYQQGIVSATNAERTSRDLGALKSQACVQRFAVKQAAKQAKQNRMFHQAMGPILKKCGLDHVGENVAYGFSNGKDVVDAWMGSPSHRANILSTRFSLVGAAARQSKNGTWYVAQVFGHKA